MGSAAALATLELIEEHSWLDVAATRGAAFAEALANANLPRVTEIRQAGLMLGLQLDEAHHALGLTRGLLERGYLVLPAGARADVIQLAPAVTVTDDQLAGFIDALRSALEAS